ncbi:WD40 repeat domain-containing protein [Marivirga arenosa]|uniref:WD40 repeat domain-containing protein n=1 Tax=Marivirga arenosa TaxID=3059076 RepID=A0AA51N671_9BACT|nr:MULTISPECIES: WD40 repeat domain-containing protein [unclassified Marivirga]WMN07017.1 WD40 repeat domain-containing protein [Marivirga sp. ABR2-2]WNB18803.1 WD40 repeat domain-containing protein [Marivirga sp. BKB1-2]
MPKINVEKVQSLTGHKDCLYVVEPAAQNNQFFSAGGDGIVALWDLKDPELGQMVAKVNNSVYALHYLRNTNHLLVGHNYEGIHLIDVENKQEVKSSKITDEAIFDIKVIDNIILSACGDGQLILSDLKDLSTIAKLQISDKSIRTIAVHPNQKEVALGLSDNTIKVLSSTDWRLKKEIKAHDNSVFTIQYSRDGKLLLSAGRDAHLKIWDAQSDYILVESIVAHMYAINNISFRSDGKYFSTCSMDKSIKIWDAQSFKLLKVIDKARHAGHATSVNKLYWTDYNDQLVSVSDDHTISIWDIQMN